MKDFDSFTYTARCEQNTPHPVYIHLEKYIELLHRTLDDCQALLIIMDHLSFQASAKSWVYNTITDCALAKEDLNALVIATLQSPNAPEPKSPDQKDEATLIGEQLSKSISLLEETQQWIYRAFEDMGKNRRLSSLVSGAAFTSNPIDNIT